MSFLNSYRLASGSGFRYLHDEISGGVFAASHLKTLESYIGDCVQLGGGSPTDFGFVDNIIDLSLIDSTYGSNQTTNIYYDQIGSNDLDTGNAVWDKTENNLIQHDGYVGLNNVATSGSLSALSGAMTIIFVFKHNAVARKTNEYLISNSGVNRIRTYYNTTTQFAFFLATGNIANRIGYLYNSGGGIPFDNDLHIMFIQYDGTEVEAGINIFVDDVVTPITPTSSFSAGAYVNTSPFANNLYQGFGGGVSGTDFQGLIYENHIFNKVLSQSERETAKEILEQYYTFS